MNTFEAYSMPNICSWLSFTFVQLLTLVANIIVMKIRVIFHTLHIDHRLNYNDNERWRHNRETKMFCIITQRNISILFLNVRTWIITNILITFTYQFYTRHTILIWNRIKILTLVIIKFPFRHLDKSLAIHSMHVNLM